MINFLSHFDLVLSPFLSGRKLMEDEGGVNTVRGKLASEEIPQNARVGEPVQAVPDCKHVEERTEHSEDHDGEEVLEKVL